MRVPSGEWLIFPIFKRSVARRSFYLDYLFQKRIIAGEWGRRHQAMHDTSPTISVLVPIYNVERYLRQCLESLRAQTQEGIEVILLDDGSTDGCAEICDEYVAKDGRFRVIHKENSGLGASYNVGLSEARGEYIGIVESDDWAEPHMYETLHGLAVRHGVEVVKSNFYQYTGRTGDVPVNIMPLGDTDHVIDPHECSEIFYAQPSIWSALYKRSFLEENHIRFLETPGASFQDNGFNFKVWAKASRVWLASCCLYHYRRDNENASVKTPGKVFCIADEWHEIERYMSEYPDEEVKARPVMHQAKMMAYMWNRDRLSGGEQRAFEELLSKEFRDVIRRGELNPKCFPRADWLRIQGVLYRDAPLKRIGLYMLRWVNQIGRLFVKRKTKNDVEESIYLCGLFRKRRAAVDSRRPTINGGLHPVSAGKRDNANFGAMPGKVR